MRSACPVHSVRHVMPSGTTIERTNSNRSNKSKAKNKNRTKNNRIVVVTDGVVVVEDVVETNGAAEGVADEMGLGVDGPYLHKPLIDWHIGMDAGVEAEVVMTEEEEEEAVEEVVVATNPFVDACPVIVVVGMNTTTKDTKKTLSRLVEDAVVLVNDSDVAWK